MNIYIHVNMCCVCVLARCPAYKNSLNKIAYIVFNKTPGNIESTLCTLKKKGAPSEQEHYQKMPIPPG